jgi:hypothetical protein
MVGETDVLDQNNAIHLDLLFASEMLQADIFAHRIHVIMKLMKRLS